MQSSFLAFLSGFSLVTGGGIEFGETAGSVSGRARKGAEPDLQPGHLAAAKKAEASQSGAARW
jgi:hypothetical protein